MKIKNFDDALKQRLDAKELKTMKAQALLEQEALRLLRRDIASAIALHMDKTGMGFNELTRKLGVSPTQASKIRRGEANLTVASIAHIAAFLGKKPHLIFD
jgi:transcriptional regulator with XRE-family HTH domain